MLSAKRIHNEIETQIRFILSWIPGGIGSRLRYYYYKKRFRELGQGVHIPVGCTIRGEKNISVGKGVGLGIYCFLYAGLDKGSGSIVIGDNSSFNSNVMVNADIKGKILIGKNVIIGPNVVFRASNHAYEKKDVRIKQQGHCPGCISVGNDVWIGANAVILPNVTIDNGVVIGAGSVVTKDVSAFSVVAGVPAQKIGMRQE